MSIIDREYKIGTQEKYYTADKTEGSVIYTTDTARLHIGDSGKLVGENLRNLQVGRNNKVVVNKGHELGATAIGKDNLVGKMGYYIMPDYLTYNTTNSLLRIYFLDHQLGNYPPEPMAKFAEEHTNNAYDNTTDEVFCTGSDVDGLEACLAYYYDTSVVDFVGQEVNISATTGIYDAIMPSSIPERTLKLVLDKITYNVTLKELNKDGGYALVEVDSSTLGITTEVEAAQAASNFLYYRVPDDIWTNDWSLSDPNDPTWGAFNIAEPTVAMGRRNHAAGSESVVFGRDSKSYGDVSAAFGVNTTAAGPGALSTGKNTTASGNYSTTFGQNTIASNINAIAGGSNSKARGENSVALGDNTEVATSAKNGFAVGYKSKVTGVRAVAMGSNGTASGADSFVFSASADTDWVYKKDADGNNTSEILELKTYASAPGAIAIGRGLAATGKNAIALGGVASVPSAPKASGVQLTTAAGISSFATGYANIAKGNYAAVFGSESTSNGNSNFSAGYKTNAGLTGTGTENTNHGAIALGFYATASLTGQAAIGNHVATSIYGQQGQVVVGSYNESPSTTSFFEVGTGSAGNRKTTFKVEHETVTVGGSLNTSSFYCHNAHVSDTLTAKTIAGVDNTLEVVGNINANGNIEVGSIKASGSIDVSGNIYATYASIPRVYVENTLTCSGNITAGQASFSYSTTLETATSKNLIVGNGYTTGKYAIAHGDGATAAGDSAIASGAGCVADGQSSLASGVRSKVISPDGNQHTATSSAAIGYEIVVDKKWCVAVGAHNTDLPADCRFAVGTGTASKKATGFYVTGSGVFNGNGDRFVTTADINGSSSIIIGNDAAIGAIPVWDGTKLTLTNVIVNPSFN